MSDTSAVARSSGLAQPALGLAALAAVLVVSFAIFAAFSADTLNGWVAFLAMTIIPTQIARTDQPSKEIREMVALKDRGWVDPAKLRTHNLGFDDVQKAYDMYANYTDDVVKVVMSLK